jgi:hypothetical protein
MCKDCIFWQKHSENWGSCICPNNAFQKVISTRTLEEFKNLERIPNPSFEQEEAFKAVSSLLAGVQRINTVPLTAWDYICLNYKKV